MTTPAPSRLHYIDFMKGLCILFIVIHHTDHGLFDLIGENTNATLQSFRIPMYYFISGIFFKAYEGFSDFVRRKVNTMIIPLVFFFMLTILLIALVNLMPFLHDIFHPITLHLIVKCPERVNLPLWFLVSLFEVNIIYYPLQQFLKRERWLAVVVILLSVGGYLLAINHLFLPCWLDTALLGLPYFVMGSMIHHLGQLKPHRLDRYGWIVLLVVLACIYPFAQAIDIRARVLPNYFYLYFVPALSILALLWACKPLQYVPVICYFGRYSLVVLGTHFPLIRLVANILYRIDHHAGLTGHCETLAVVLIIELALIWLLTRYLPHFTAQKPLFEKGWRPVWHNFCQ